MGEEVGGFRNDAEVEEVVRGFESCALAPNGFKHRQHLAVALWLLRRLPFEEALKRMREDLYRFLAAHGVDSSKYHETLTVFWLRRVQAFLARAGEGRGLAELANELAEECGDARLAFSYYSEALVASDDARSAWAEPDLKALDF